MTITTVLTEQEQNRFRESVRYANAIAKRLFGEYHPRDAQVIASTLFIQSMRMDTDNLKPLAQLYLNAGQLAASCFPNSYPPVILSAAATLFIQHVARELEQLQPAPEPEQKQGSKERARRNGRSAGKRASKSNEYIGVRELVEQELTLVPEGG